jgi:hypothetical protein
MTAADLAQIDELKKVWTDRLVRFRPPAPAGYARLATAVGRVVTVSYSGRAVVDFGDGAWTDVADFAAVLEDVPDADRPRYDPTANGAQPRPGRQA